jgi:methylenetetrahydrofolate dehydrogenase (NADP+) / methenyltetrahydrofolate cyclohydrolase
MLFCRFALGGARNVSLKGRIFFPAHSRGALMTDTTGILKPLPSGALMIDGKAASALVLDEVKHHVRGLAGHGIKPGLAVVLVGEDPASQVYVKAKGKAARECGFHSVQHTLPASTSEAELLALVAGLNADPAIHGILVQLPLPKAINAARVLEAIVPAKDVDGFHPINVGLIAIGETGRALVPCTPAGSMVLLRKACAALGLGLAGLNAVVVGRSNIVGKPMAQLLLAENCTVTIAHSRTQDLPQVVRQADIVVAAVGRAEMIRGDWLKHGAIVIDVGINRIAAEGGKTRLVGDVAYAEAVPHVRAITPVPGGVGPMTIAMLMANTCVAAHRIAGLQAPVF